MGSMRVARRAGSQQASSPAARSTVVTPANVSPSVAVTPNRMLSTTRVVAAAASSPRTLPTATSVPPCRTTSRTTSARPAPSAMRTPNSRRRRDTA